MALASGPWALQAVGGRVLGRGAAGVGGRLLRGLGVAARSGSLTLLILPQRYRDVDLIRKLRLLGFVLVPAARVIFSAP